MTSKNLLSWERLQLKDSSLVLALVAAIPSMSLCSVIATESSQEGESLPFCLWFRPLVCDRYIVSA